MIVDGFEAPTKDAKVYNTDSIEITCLTVSPVLLLIHPEEDWQMADLYSSRNRIEVANAGEGLTVELGIVWPSTAPTNRAHPNWSIRHPRYYGFGLCR
jgi:hypothetical protein